MRGIGVPPLVITVYLARLLLLTGRLCEACNVHGTCLGTRCWQLLYNCYMSREEARTRCNTDYVALATYLTTAEIEHLAYVISVEKQLTDNTFWVDGDVVDSATKTAQWYDGTLFTYDRADFSGTCVRLFGQIDGPYLDTNGCTNYLQAICLNSSLVPVTTAGATTAEAATTEAATTEATTPEASTMEATTEPDTTTLVTTEAETTTTITTSTPDDITVTLTIDDTTMGATEDTTAATAEDVTAATTEDITMATTDDVTTATTEDITTVTTQAATTTHQMTTLTEVEDTTVTTIDAEMKESSSVATTMDTTNNPYSSTAQSVATSTTEEVQCYCLPCVPNGTTTVSTISMSQLPLSEFVLSKRRKGETRPDNRPSAVAIGSMGVGVLVTVAAVIIIPDLPRILSDVRHAIRHCCCHGNDTDPENAPKRKKK